MVKCATWPVLSIIIFLFLFSDGLLRAEEAPRSLYGDVLREHVRDGLVDYERLKSDDRLAKYLEWMAEVDTGGMDREERMAFWLNAYNAHTLHLIASNYPVDSINDLHFAGNIYIATVLFLTVWHTHEFRAGAMDDVDLDYIEHTILRPMGDYRIHAAIVCAAISCPPLRNEPYRAESLDSQLNDQMRVWLADKKRNRYDPDENTLHISAIFDWFEDDFVSDDQNLLDVLLPYLPVAVQMQIAERDEQPDIEFMTYDWALNQIPR